MTGFTVLALEADVLTVELADGPARFHAIWLRDNARDDASRPQAGGCTGLGQPHGALS